MLKFNLKAWRNGSVSDSRSAGWGFKSLCLHFLLFLIILKILWNNSNKGRKKNNKIYCKKYKKFKRNKLINNNKTKNAKFNNDKK